MKEIKINKKGRETLIDIVLSCMPIAIKKSFNLEMVKHIKTLDQDVVSLEDLHFDPRQPMHLLIITILQHEAERLGQSVIDREFILKHFGGEGHLVKAKEDVTFVREVRQPPWLIAHMLLPVSRAGSAGEFISAIYSNGGESVKLSNIYVPAHLRSNDQKSLLVHYGSVISIDHSDELVESILDMQLKMVDFLRACNCVKEIDYRMFLNIDFTQRTKEFFVS
jgi:hypothetical protein